MNRFIEEWKKGAKLIIKCLAETQLEMIDKKKKPMNEEQQECYEYLKKVSEDGEL